MGSQHGYDYVIVGGGSAGCVLANRLSEDGGARVLLLEAGGSDRDPLIHVPLGMGKMLEYRLHDWGYKAEPEPALGGRAIDANRGKVLGGSSAINVMAYTRGHPGDYDRWAAGGAAGWSYAEVLPYFRRCETWEGGADPWRGGSGPLGTEWAKTRDPLYEAWIAAGEAAGFPYTPDYNGAQQEGFGRSQCTIRDGRRSSASRAFLRPARRRPNLTVVTGALASRVLLQGTRATGIEYRRNGVLATATAEREVILAAGAFNSPQLLMLSGIGPAGHLREHGIAAVADLPVGRNLQDHLGVWLIYARREPGEFHRQMRLDRMVRNMLQAYFFGSGPGTVVPGGLHAFVKTRPGLAVPDIEFMFRSAPLKPHLWIPGLRPAYGDGYGIRPTLLHPASRGEIRLRSADPAAPPRICYNFFSEPADLPQLRDGVRRAREVAHQPAMAPFRGAETSPGPKVMTDDEIDAFIRRTTVTAYHPAGTCRMGSGAEAVLDSELRVRGIEALRVVDASAMPDLVSAHINACVLMMAEKAADLVLGRPAPAK